MEKLVRIFVLLLHISTSIVSTNDERNKSWNQYSTQQEVVTRFLYKMDEYLKIQHYGSYRHQLELVGPKVVRTDSDRKCLQQLYFAMNNPIVYRWTSKCKSNLFRTFFL